MNRNELIDIIASEIGETKATTGRFLDSLITTIQNTVAAGDKVTLVGFGSFDTVITKARKGRNPSTGETITIDASIRPKFTPGSTFKSQVKDKKAGN